MKRVSAALLLLLLTNAFGSTADELFRAANAAYEAQDYRPAIALYDSALALAPSAPAYYNRGNARFKTGELGRAVADYNRALILHPADEDIRHNLEFLRAYRPDRATAIPNPLVALVTRVVRLPDISTSRALAALIFLLGAAAAAFGLILGRRGAYWLALGLGVLWLYFLGAWLSWRSETGPDRAVVVVPELILRSGPGEEYKDLLIVHDGLEVAIRNRRGNHLLVQAPGGEGGWADSTGFERIFTPGK